MIKNLTKESAIFNSASKLIGKALKGAKSAEDNLAVAMRHKKNLSVSPVPKSAKGLSFTSQRPAGLTDVKVPGTTNYMRNTMKTNAEIDAARRTALGHAGKIGIGGLASYGGYKLLSGDKKR